MSIVEVGLVYSLVVVALEPGTVSPDERVLLASVTYGWVMQAVVALGLAVALPWLWYHVRRPDREAAWLAGERLPDDGLRPPHRACPARRSRRHAGRRAEAPAPDQCWPCAVAPSER